MSDLAADTEDDRNLGILLYRVKEIAGTVKELVTWRREVDQERVRLRQDADTLAKQMVRLEDAVNSLRKTLVGLAVTVAVSCLGFALSVLAATGRI